MVPPPAPPPAGSQSVPARQGEEAWVFCPESAPKLSMSRLIVSIDDAINLNPPRAWGSVVLRGSLDTQTSCQTLSPKCPKSLWARLQQKLDPTTLPPPPQTGMASNAWRARDLTTSTPDTMWTVWWHRWSADVGAYFLYAYQTSKNGGMAANQKEVGEHFDAVDQQLERSIAGHGGHPTTSSALNDEHAEPSPLLSARAHINDGRRILQGVPAHMASPAARDPPATPLAHLPLYDFHMRPVHGWRGTLAQRRGLLDALDGSCE